MLASSGRMVGFESWYQALGDAESAYSQVARAAFGPEQYVGQQGLSTRDEILALANATISPGATSVLDLCCGGGATLGLIRTIHRGLLIGADLAQSGLDQARTSADDLALVRCEVERLPFGDASLDAALLIDSFASMTAPERLFCDIGRALRPGGRLGLTAEVGAPLSREEQAQFTRSEPPTVITETEMRRLLQQADLDLVTLNHRTASTAALARRLVAGLRRNDQAVAAELGAEAVADVTATLGVLADMLGNQRLAEIEVVAQRA
jgi:SAM-dependent methyltransferase